MAKYFGFNPPWFSGQSKVMSRQEDDRLIKNDILQLINTLPGERVRRPDFGCRMRLMVFEGDTLNLQDEIRSEITSAITKWEPRVNLNFVNVTSDKVKQTYNIQIGVTVKTNPGALLLVEQLLKTGR